MLGAYLTDVIRKVEVDADEFGKITETESADIKSRVEDFNRLLINDMGQEVMGSMIIMIETTTLFAFGDKIVIKKKADYDYEQPNKKFIVQKKSRLAGFSDSHWELYV